jgi:hypothetical protein
MKNIGNFNDMSNGDLNIDINNVFGDDAPSDSNDDVSQDDNVTINKDTQTSDDDLNIDAFFNANLSDDDKDNKDEVDSPDSDKNSDDKSSSNSAPSNFTAILAKDLMDQGIISTISDEDFKSLVDEKGEAEALRSLIQSEVNNASNSLKSDYDESYQEYLTLIEGGVDKNAAGDLIATKNTFDAITETQLDDEDNESLRRDLIMEHYRLTTKLTDVKIKKLVDRSFELGEDVEEAKDALASIKATIVSRIDEEKTSAKDRETQQKQQLEDSRNKLKSSIEDLKEILPGQKINKQTKDKMFELITKPVQGKDGNTTNAIWAKRSEDPIEFDQKLAYLLQTGFFEKGKSWDKVKTVKTTNEANELEQFLANNTTRTGTMRVRDTSKEAQDMIKSTASILNNR